jgi:hypothetical protein
MTETNAHILTVELITYDAYDFHLSDEEFKLLIAGLKKFTTEQQHTFIFREYFIPWHSIKMIKLDDENWVDALTRSDT